MTTKIEYKVGDKVQYVKYTKCLYFSGLNPEIGMTGEIVAINKHIKPSILVKTEIGNIAFRPEELELVSEE